MRYLVLRLTGPLMSFGEGDYWDIRGTDAFPTKSAIVGVLASCMGYDRNDIDSIAKLNNSISVSCRQDNQFSLLRDYHTILDTLKADGSWNKNAVQSYRQYLMDAKITVIVSSEDTELLAQLKEALEDPTWTPFLGRKSCSPSVPIYWGEEIESENAKQAFEKLSLLGEFQEHEQWNGWFSENKTRIQRSMDKFACISDEKIAEGRKSLIRDNVVNPKLRVFSQREVYKFYVTKKPGEIPSCS